MKGNHTISYINIGLMLLSVVLALLFPFELFLFSIIILGPLHYLTEISWLEKRSFFAQSKWNILFLALLTIIILIPTINSKSSVTPYQIPLIMGAFAYAVGLIRHKSLWVNLAYFGVTFLVGAMLDLGTQYWFVIIFGVFLPTIIHVLIFTGLFLLSGALKNKTRPEYASVLVFIGCIAIILWPNYSFTHYSVSRLAKELYIGPLATLNAALSGVLGIGTMRGINDVFTGPGPLKIMSLIAFAYTYHYFNWFSKTTIIKWHEVSKFRLAGITVVWILVVALCAYDYKTGFLALSFLSLLHVAFEFPLNVRSMGDIKRSVFG